MTVKDLLTFHSDRGVDIYRFYVTGLRAVRELFGKSRYQVAEELDVTEEEVRQLENGTMSPDIKFLHQISTSFMMTPRFLFASLPVETVVEESKISCHECAQSHCSSVCLEARYLDFADGLITYLSDS
ncbi:helix-turn-helix domain-containing protein [Lacticaseibacillus porcinae]|uniref:helix-turn-helix domain-containing protein n=1 Tax=Lacticaseibacillus porcinae TaxID=1123687 RepID=UPI001CDD88E0